MSHKYCLVYSTCPSLGNYSNLISKQLVLGKLAACVSVIDNVSSVYTWENKLETSLEKLLIIKTSIDLFEQVKEKILELHPYTSPEIISVPIINGANDYLSWMNNSLKS